MFRTLLVLSLPALLGAAGGGLAEPQFAPPGERPSRARLITRLHLVRTQHIQAALGIPEAQAKGIADRWSQFDLEAHVRRQGLRATRQKIQDLLTGPGTEEDKNRLVAPALAQFAALHKQHGEAKQKLEEDLQRMLTPVQQARFLLLMEDFQRKFTQAVGG